MPRIRIKRIPEDVYEVLTLRANEADLPLADYLRQRVIQYARTPTPEELFRRRSAEGLGQVPLADAAKAVQVDRHQR
jgi:hypothetical protein